MLRLAKFLFLLLSLSLSTSIFADKALVARPEVQQFMATMMKKHGFQKKQLLETLEAAEFQPKIIESMNKPYEKKPWNVYKDLFITSERVAGGLAFWRTNQAALAKAEQQFKVPANIIVAIIGVETRYGKEQGRYRVLDALSTLAFDYPSRAPFFKKELEEFLLLCREHRVPATQYLGSYAGAMGKPQFMPSSYRFYAANFSGKAKKDLMQDDEAVIASVANYIHRHGWRFEQGIAEEAKITSNRYKNIETSYKSAAYTPVQLARAGVKPLGFSRSHAQKAGLIELSLEKGKEYWLAYPNFYVITRYNTSPQYAMAVYLLSKELKTQWANSSNERKRLA